MVARNISVYICIYIYIYNNSKTATNPKVIFVQLVVPLKLVNPSILPDCDFHQLVSSPICDDYTSKSNHYYDLCGGVTKFNGMTS